MRVVLSVILLFTLWYKASASHIVGGEFELRHLSGSSYRLSLILYFDEINGNPGARDPFADVRIFRKRDNAIMINAIRLLQVSITNVPYTQPSCSKGEIVTSRILYSADIQLPASQFNDAQGYYVAWERCCRNYTITNIFSENPVLGNRTAGQTFYMEFPPVVKDGSPFINSSPRLFPPLNDYACPNKKYYVDFAGVDDDGDSLVYSLVTPLNTKSADALPPGNLPRPAPYPDVQWRPGYSLQRITRGSPDLQITPDGFLTVTPPLAGVALYVFAVKCEEYRNGVKIGEVRRDFQMLVVDACPVAEPPQIVGRKKGEVNFSVPNQTLALSYSNTVSATDRCVEVRISDEDSKKPEDGFQEKVSIRVLPLNFKNNTRYLNELLPAVSAATLVNGSAADFTICFPECSYVPGGIYQIGVIAYDDACSLPLSDTLRLSVFVEPPPNQPPIFITPDQQITINEGDPLLTIPILAEDADLDQLEAFFITDGFTMANAGVGLNLVTAEKGKLTGAFTWDSRCDVFDFTQRTTFLLKVFVEDQDKCRVQNRDTLTFNLNIILPGNNDPLISSNLQQGNEKRIEVTRKIFESLQFDVFGRDADNDFIVLGMKGKGFNAADAGVVFNGAQGNGSVQSPFSWNLNCERIDLSKQTVYDLEFIVVDNANKCRLYKADTLLVSVRVEPPDNTPPTLTIASMNDVTLAADRSIKVFQGTEIQLKLTAIDPDFSPADMVFIDLLDVKGNVLPVSFTFTPGVGTGRAEAFFTWLPDCSIFTNNMFENNYEFTFVARDNRCYSAGEDLGLIKLQVNDYDRGDFNFIPPNIVTPDGNGKNEYFAMERYQAPGEYVSILPPDNCLGTFVNIRIYDRWGNQVYESTDRNFRWYPRGASAGVYFYYLTYTNMIYKGSVSVKY
ncbi:MAG: gliding motility-associated C-terminal domain-containing protein [Cyclobacteriaceae bacterium]|jgi:hypothetical protein|nr:gliding motility-associated C-terminal domain-containing protein [Cyclobacteriaceae bacterium]